MRKLTQLGKPNAWTNITKIDFNSETGNATLHHLNGYTTIVPIKEIVSIHE